MVVPAPRPPPAFQTIHGAAPMLDREPRGREASSTAGMLDSWTVKAPRVFVRGGQEGARPQAARRAVDADGRPLTVDLTMADAPNAAWTERIVKAV